MEGSIPPSVPAPATLPSSAASTPTAVGPEFATNSFAPCDGPASQRATVSGAGQRMPMHFSAAGSTMMPSRLRIQGNQQSENTTQDAAAAVQDAMEVQQLPPQYTATNGWYQAAAQTPGYLHHNSAHNYLNSAAAHQQANIGMPVVLASHVDVDNHNHNSTWPTTNAVSQQQQQQAYTWQQQQQLNIPTWQQQQQGWFHNRSSRDSRDTSRGHSRSPRGRRRQQQHHHRNTPRSSSLHYQPQTAAYSQPWPQQQLHQQPVQPPHLQWQQQQHQYGPRRPRVRNTPSGGQPAAPWLPAAAYQGHQQQPSQQLAPPAHHLLPVEQPVMAPPPPPPPPARPQQWQQQHSNQTLSQQQLQPPLPLQPIRASAGHNHNGSHRDEAHRPPAANRQVWPENSRLQELPTAGYEAAFAAADADYHSAMLQGSAAVATATAGADAAQHPSIVPVAHAMMSAAPAEHPAMPVPQLQHQQQDQGHVIVESHRISQLDIASDSSDDADVWFDGSYSLLPQHDLQQREQFHAAMAAAASRYEHLSPEAHYDSVLSGRAMIGAPVGAGQSDAAARLLDRLEALYQNDIGGNSVRDVNISPSPDVVPDYSWDLRPPDWRALGLSASEYATAADRAAAAMGSMAADDGPALHGGYASSPLQHPSWHEVAWRRPMRLSSPGGLSPAEAHSGQQQQQQQFQRQQQMQWQELYPPALWPVAGESEDDAVTPMAAVGGSSQDAMAGFPRYDPLSQQHRDSAQQQQQQGATRTGAPDRGSTADRPQSVVRASSGMQQTAAAGPPELPQLARVRTTVPARSGAALDDSPSAQMAQVMRQLHQQYIALQQQRYEATWQRLQLREQLSQRRGSVGGSGTAIAQQAGWQGGSVSRMEPEPQDVRPVPPLIDEMPSTAAGGSSSNAAAARASHRPQDAASASPPAGNSSTTFAAASSSENAAVLRGTAASAEGPMRELLEVASRSTMEVDTSAIAAMAGSWQLQQQQLRQQSGSQRSTQGFQPRRSYAWLYEAQRQQQLQAVMNAIIADEAAAGSPRSDQHDHLPPLIDADPASVDDLAPVLYPDPEPLPSSSISNRQGSNHAAAAAAGSTMEHLSRSRPDERYQRLVTSEGPGLPQFSGWDDVDAGVQQPNSVPMASAAGHAAGEGGVSMQQHRAQQQLMTEAVQLQQLGQQQLLSEAVHSRHRWSSSSIASPTVHQPVPMPQVTPSAAATSTAGSATVLQTPYASGINNENFVTPEAAIMPQQQQQPPPVRQPQRLRQQQQQVLVSPRGFTMAPLSAAAGAVPLESSDTADILRARAAAARSVGTLSPAFAGHSNQAQYRSSSSTWNAPQQRRRSSYRDYGLMEAARGQPLYIPAEEEGAHILAAIARQEAIAREREVALNAQLSEGSARRADGIHRSPAIAAGQRHVHPVFQTISNMGPGASSSSSRDPSAAASILDHRAIAAGAAGVNLSGLMFSGQAATLREQQEELERQRQRLQTVLHPDLATAAASGRRWQPLSVARAAGLTPYGRAGAGAEGLISGPGADVMLRVLRRMGLDEPLDVDLANMFWGGGPLSYEQLIGLEDVRVVVPEHVLSQLPRRIVPLPDKQSKAAPAAPSPSSGADSAICPICQCDLAGNELVVQLPCKHDYHESCICEWLSKYKKTCPVCKAEVV